MHAIAVLEGNLIGFAAGDPREDSVWVVSSNLSEKLNTAFKKFDWIGVGESLLCHWARPLSALLFGRPRVVECLSGRRVRWFNCADDLKLL